MLKQTEKSIGNMIAAQMAVAGPVMSLLATGVGVGAPWILVGVVSTAVIAGGAVLLAGAAFAGLLAGILSVGYVQKINNQTEIAARVSVFESVMFQLQKWPRTDEFREFVSS